MTSCIEEIRGASRALVRELGFMGGAFAGTDLSPSAVHALIEIEAGRAVTARDLSAALRLEKSSVSRMLGKLVRAGDVVEEPDAADGRVKALALTAAGRARVGAIHAFARGQVARALDRLPEGKAGAVAEGLRLYAEALGPGEAPAVTVARGWRTGLIARIVGMHAAYYARAAGFGRPFEAVVAQGLAEFCGRLDDPRNGIWTAVAGGEVMGSVAIDGADLGPGVAHLRWFIVEEGLRGQGVGRALLDAALGHVDALGFRETQLWTFAGLDAARRLYEAAGFRLAEERAGSQWGREVLEQRFVRAMAGG